MSARNAFREPSRQEDEIAAAIVDAAIRVHRRLGPGLLEKIYEVCFCYELTKAGYRCERQLALPIVYDHLRFEEGLQLDVLVEDLVVCELKAVDKVHPIHEAQLLSHMRLAERSLGFLLN